MIFSGNHAPWNQANLIASTGQELAAASQSQLLHLSGAMTHALSSLISNTSGQSSAHVPQPMQRSISTVGSAMTILLLI
jgi:hypothetical protein